ncbi:MAG TPA: hypothetical protein VGI05_11180 [Streptosporangiaceae bacterium]
MDEQEHSASPETPASGETAPVNGPAAAAGATAGTGPAARTGPEAGTGAAAGPGRERRGDGARDVLTSRGAGWAVAAAMAGAVVGLSVAMATSSSPTVVGLPDSATGLPGTAAGVARAAAPGRALRAVAAGGGLQATAPARLRIQTPARLRIQVPIGGPLQAPARLRIQVPAGSPLQAPARLRLLAPVSGPAETLVPLPGAAQVLPDRQAIAGVVAPRAVRLRVRPGQVRVRLRVPANGRLQVLPGSQGPGQLRVVPGPRQAALAPTALVPPARARLHIVFRNGTPVPARLLIPAGQPGQARLRIQVPARARIQVPARARITPALPAPPNW